jgi:predicted oxidoreductase
VGADPAVALYGCMGLGGDWDAPSWGAPELARAEAAVEAALDAGITWFDHADIYGRGKAEAVFGEVLARHPGLRGRIVLQTKCGIRLPGDGRGGYYDSRAETVRARVEQSLERLRTDRVDVLLLHRPDPLTHPAEVAAALQSLHRQGLVGAIGVSNMSHHQVVALQDHLDLPVVANQLEMSLHARAFVEGAVLVNTPEGAASGFPAGTLEHARRHGIGLQAWGALAQGRYTGRTETAADRATEALVRRLAGTHGTTPETVVLWWLRRHPAGIAPVLGSTRPERITACRDAVLDEPRLTHEEWYELWVTARGAPLP